MGYYLMPMTISGFPTMSRLWLSKYTFVIRVGVCHVCFVAINNNEIVLLNDESVVPFQGD